VSSPSLLIDGRHQAASQGTPQDVVDASTEDVIATLQLAGRSDVDAAVAAARRAFDSGPWATTTAAERAGYLDALCQALLARGDDVARTVSQENGNSIATSPMVQALSAAVVPGYFAQVAREFAFDLEPRTGLYGNPVHISRRPLGVVAAIVPWNVPLTIAMLKLGPVLAAGCTAVVKPDPQTALSAQILIEAVQASGFPDGVINVLPADRDVSEYLVCHPDVDKVSLTGSTATGRRVAALCGKRIRPCTLELGGKSAAIVTDSAELDHLIAGLLPGMTMINGQACVAQTRLLVPASRADEITQAFAEAFTALRVGNALDPDTDIGPLISETQRARVLGYIERGVADGATVAAGGKATSVDGRGFYVEPTLLTDVHPDALVAQDEIFGPVIVVLRYDDIGEAVAIANNSQYGLSGSVWTKDPDEGLAIARRIKTGAVNVNYFSIEVGAPFGGSKSSGLGREGGPEALDGYLEYGSIGVQSPA